MLPFKLLYAYGVFVPVFGVLLITTWRKASFQSDVLLTAFLYVLVGFLGVLVFGNNGEPIQMN